MENLFLWYLTIFTFVLWIALMSCVIFDKSAGKEEKLSAVIPFFVLSLLCSIISSSITYCVTVSISDLSNNCLISYEERFKNKQLQSVITEIYNDENNYNEFRDNFISKLDLDSINKEDKTYIIKIANYFTRNYDDRIYLLKMFPETEGAKQIKIFEKSMNHENNVEEQ